MRTRALGALGMSAFPKTRFDPSARRPIRDGYTQWPTVTPRGMKDVSEVERVMTEEMESLQRDDQLWLAECLEEYSDLLTYLHDH